MYEGVGGARFGVWGRKQSGKSGRGDRLFVRSASETSLENDGPSRYEPVRKVLAAC